MSNIFLTSDTHFGHKNICLFTREDGSPLRPWDDPDTMDAEMVQRWNSVVGAKDTVYHLGDVVINRRCLKTLDLLNGSKRLIMGNHDIFDYTDYTPYFKHIHGSHKINEFMLTHIPVHKESVARWATNIHGHIHARDIIDCDYLNVSVEMTDYTPISLDEVLDRVRIKRETYPNLP